MTTDGNNLYVIDTGTYKIRKINIATTEVTTLAGSGDRMDSVGSTSAAGFYFSNSSIGSGIVYVPTYGLFMGSTFGVKKID